MPKLTKKKAKKICLEIWECLRDNPEIDTKMDLPKKLFNKIKEMRGECPLCDYMSCSDGCPLQTYHSGCHDFENWCDALTKRGRKKHAGIIVKKVKAWKV